MAVARRRRRRAEAIAQRRRAAVVQEGRAPGRRRAATAPGSVPPVPTSTVGVVGETARPRGRWCSRRAGSSKSAWPRATAPGSAGERVREQRQRVQPVRERARPGRRASGGRSCGCTNTSLDERAPCRPCRRPSGRARWPTMSPRSDWVRRAPTPSNCQMRPSSPPSGWHEAQAMPPPESTWKIGMAGVGASIAGERDHDRGSRGRRRSAATPARASAPRRGRAVVGHRDRAASRRRARTRSWLPLSNRALGAGSVGARRTYGSGP